jgi:hypothetical protein
MKTIIPPIFKVTLTAAAITFTMAAPATMAAAPTAEWVNGDNILNAGDTIQSTAATTNKNSYTNNPALKNNAWGMNGAWLSFEVPSATNVLVSLTSKTTNAPGFTIYRTDGSFIGNGTGTADTVTNGAIHNFNQVAQAGTAGIIFATDDSVSPSLPGNTTANGIVETLGYVNGSNVDYVNGYGLKIDAGAHDLSIDDLYENGVFGNIAEVGGLNHANLTLVNLAAGFYTIFLGNTNTGGTDTPIDVKVSAPPVLPMDCLYRWAEINYSDLFSPAGATSQTLESYYYRYYQKTNSYLGISSIDNHVYYQGPHGVIQDMGASSPWLTIAGCN